MKDECLLLDSNVRESFFKDSAKYDRFFRELPRFTGKQASEYTCAITPLSVLELIGFKSQGRINPVAMPQKMIDKINEHAVDSPESNDLIEEMAIYLLEENKKRISQLDEFRGKNIIGALRRKRSSIHPHMRKFYFDLYFREIEENPNVEMILEWLALDRVLATFYNVSKSYHLNRYLYVTMVKFLQDRRNNSFARLSHRIWQDLLRRMPNPSQKLLSDCELIEKYCNYKEGGDLLDADIVHYACVGRFTDEKSHRVLCCASDPIESTVFRISQLKSFLKRIKEDYTSFANITFESGAIIFIDRRESKILKMIKVNDIH